ncbi:MAG: hypothetical protein MI802_21735 [Desulfobacterales bacterium]|nr:hypothetical protein [Desulfobacterales bacterium]
MSKLTAIAENPWLNLISGVILIITAGSQIIQTFGDGHIGAHHGVAVFGLVQVIQCLPHILHGTEQMSKINKE